MFKRYDFVIINRSFWPENQIIGKALFELAVKISNQNKHVAIITQHKSNLKKTIDKLEKKSNLSFYSCKSRSNSSTNLFLRVIDALIFMLWVFLNLIIIHPKKIYVSTDPPIFVPFVVFLYSKMFNISYIYHLQDIHPELTNITVKLNPIILFLFKKVDGLILRHASNIITITKTMKDEIFARSNTNSNIYLLNNPSSVDGDIFYKKNKIKGFIFSGNLGRLQRIPLLLKSIEKYKIMGGNLSFLFVGRGLYSRDLNNLISKYKDVKYVGWVDSKKANKLVSDYEWALLPIDDEATKYAFPSKTSTYVSCGSKILSICSKSTCVAKWVLKNKYGINSPPKISQLVEIFFKIEKGFNIKKYERDRYCFSIKYFVSNLYEILFNYKKVKN